VLVKGSESFGPRLGKLGYPRKQSRSTCLANMECHLP
jgi:hypothetical protein